VRGGGAARRDHLTLVKDRRCLKTGHELHTRKEGRVGHVWGGRGGGGGKKKREKGEWEGRGGGYLKKTWEAPGYGVERAGKPERWSGMPIKNKKVAKKKNIYTRK